MRKRYRLLVPYWHEVLGYTAYTGLALVLLNGGALRNKLLRNSGADSLTQETIGSAIGRTLDSVTSPLQGQLGNAVLWGLTALITFLMVVAIGSLLRGLLDDSLGLIRGRTKTASAAKFNRIRIIVRLASSLALVMWVVILVLYIVPFILWGFYTLFALPQMHWYALPLGTLLVCFSAICIYIIAILCRLTALRIRVFSDTVG